MHELLSDPGRENDASLVHGMARPLQCTLGKECVLQRRGPVYRKLYGNREAGLLLDI